MKVKLLRKLHKRFIWKKDKTKNCWTIYNIKDKSVHYAFVVGVYYVNDMALYIMFQILGKLDKFVSLNRRLENKKK